MKFTKRNFIIYAIALMLVTAGYFNYLNFDNRNMEVSSNVMSNEISSNQIEEKIPDTEDSEISPNNEESEVNIGDAVLVSNNEVLEEEIKEEKEEDDQFVEFSANVENKIDTNYFAETRLQRDKIYAEMINKYQEIISNSNSSEIQKSIATQEITKINNNKNAIMICENLILTKDFEECVILINDKSINIVVQTNKGLNTEKVSQIQNIISRELSIEIEDIHISELEEKSER